MTTAFPSPLVVTVKDSFGNLISGAAVTFSAPTSGASGLFAGSATYQTNTSAGVATSATLTANGTPGPYTVTASVAGLGSQAQFTLTNTPRPAAQIKATGGTPQSTVVNTAFSQNLQVTVMDSVAGPVSGASVTFTAPASGASGTFGNGTNTFTTTTNSSGIASAAFKANTKAGAYQVSATTTGVSATATFSLTNNAGAAAAIAAVSGAGQSASINTAFALPLKVSVTDSFGNPVSGVTVNFVPPSSGASAVFAAGATAVTDNTGTATSGLPKANGATGSYSVSAVAGSLSTSFVLTNLPGPVTSLATVGSGQSAPVGTAFGVQLKVVAKDAAGNVVPGAQVIFTAPSTGASGTFAGGGTTATVKTDGAGTATAPVLTANSKAGGYTVTAASGTASASFTLTNLPGPAAAIAATAGNNQLAPAGSPFATQLQATVTDVSGNTVPGVNVTFTVNASSGTGGTFAGGASTASVSTDSAGVATAPVLTASGPSGAFTVTASINSSTVTTFNLTVRGGGTPANVLVVSGNEQAVAAGSAVPLPLEALVTDTSNNPVQGVNVTFTAPTGSSSATFAGGKSSVTVSTNGSGIAISPALTANSQVGTYVISAAVSGVSAQAQFRLANYPPPCTTGGCGTISVSSATIGKNLEGSITVTLNPPAPSSGLYLTYLSNDSTRLLVGSNGVNAGNGFVFGNPNGNPNIPAGTQSFSIEAQALASSGTATVTVVAAGYGAGIGTVTFAPSGFAIAGPNGIGAPFNAFEGASTDITVDAGYLDSNGGFAGMEAIRGGFSVSVPVSSSNLPVGSLSPTSVSLSGGQSSGVTSFTAGTTTGTTNLSVTQPSGFVPPNNVTTLTATVQQAGLIPFTATVGTGLEAQEFIHLSGPAAGTVTITITTSSSAVAFACNPGETTTVCTTPNQQGPAQSITLKVTQGFSVSPVFLVEATGSSTTTASYTASAPGFGPVNGNINVVQAALGIQSPPGLGAPSFTAPSQAGTVSLTIFTGYFDTTGNFIPQNLVNGPLSITATSSNTGVASVSSPIRINAGNDNGTTGLVPANNNVSGSTVVTVSAPGFTAANVNANFVNQQPILTVQGDSVVGNGFELPYTVSLQNNAGSSGQPITVSSNNPNVLLSATAAGTGAQTLNLTVPAGGLAASFFVQGASNAGTATLTLSSPGYKDLTTSVSLAPGAVIIAPSVSGAANSTGSDQLFFVYLDNTNTPQFDNSLLLANNSITIGVSSANSSVASVPSTIKITPGNGPGGVPVTFGSPSGASTTITITEPAGFGQPNKFTTSTVSIQ